MRHMPQHSKIEETLAAPPDRQGLGRISIGASADRERSALLSVCVIVDLFQSPSAGGHVKTWEKLAEAARGEPLDLTVYFFGDRQTRQPLGAERGHRRPPSLPPPGPRRRWFPPPTPAPPPPRPLSPARFPPRRRRPRGGGPRGAGQR